MNYLAHIFLSGEDTQIQMGNYIGDIVKGKQYQVYDRQVQKGILLHRQIDSFTDQHSIVKQSKRRLTNRFGHYGGVLIDVFYDHFLVKNWNRYSSVSLPVFASNFYKVLQDQNKVIPDSMRIFTERLISNNGFVNYNSISGVSKVLYGIERQINRKFPLHLGIQDLEDNYLALESDFLEFFPILQEQVLLIKHKLNNTDEIN